MEFLVIIPLPLASAELFPRVVRAAVAQLELAGEVEPATLEEYERSIRGTKREILPVLRLSVTGDIADPLVLARRAEDAARGALQTVGLRADEARVLVRK